MIATKAKIASKAYELVEDMLTDGMVCQYVETLDNVSDVIEIMRSMNSKEREIMKRGMADESLQAE